MPEDREIVYAASREEAMEQVYALYPTATHIEIESRRNALGHFSAWGHTFVIKVEYEEGEDDLGDELGEDEY